ncbi:SlyX family protein [Chitinivorax sp. B]|uniref:SlyX family protein n=1 Tax=Chitinivorax sp. B TaxID=2502235 RepID=UPI0010F86CEA|nr:SlyX family protein [Chitinivorax sp. B]
MEDRINELEIKLSFQEDLLDTLNQTVVLQQQQIDSLQRQLQMLYQQFRDMKDRGEEGGLLANERPPHY